MRRPKTAKPPSSRLVAFSGAAVALMHAVPIGIVQFAHYASDLGVIFSFRAGSEKALDDARASDPVLTELYLNGTIDLEAVEASGNGTTAAFLRLHLADDISFRFGLGMVAASVGVVWLVALVGGAVFLYGVLGELTKPRA